MVEPTNQAVPDDGRGLPHGVVDNAIYVDGRRTDSPDNLDETFEMLRARGGMGWIGLYRPTPADGFLVVGRLPGTERVSVAAMHSGITLAPAVGLFLADEILTGAREALLAPYRPERFAA